jgi:hypothetical protein
MEEIGDAYVALVENLGQKIGHRGRPKRKSKINIKMPLDKTPFAVTLNSCS